MTLEEEDASLDQERLVRQQRLREIRASGKRFMAVLEWDIDRHGAGCTCGACNSNGKSYGTAVFDVSQVAEEVLLIAEELVDSLQRMEPEPVIVLYAADADVSQDRARAWVAAQDAELW